MEPQRQGGLADHGAIAASSAEYSDSRWSLRGCRQLPQTEATGLRVHLNGGQALLHRRSLFRPHTGDQTQLARCGKSLKNGTDLIRRLVFAPDGLHHPQAATAVQVQTGILQRSHQRADGNDCCCSSPSASNGNSGAASSERCRV